MNPAGRHQPDQVSRAAALLELAEGVAQCRHHAELALGYCQVDARQILKDHTARPDIGVADFGISHLPVGQADIVFARL